MKMYSDSTLMRMTKSELIEHLRCAEHNEKAIQETLEQHINNVKDWGPVVHAYWKHSDKYNFWLTCSNCENCYVEPDWIAENKWAYCPHCGAKMDEVTE